MVRGACLSRVWQISSIVITRADTVWKHSKEKEEVPLTDDQLMLATPVLYGFSLADKLWRMSMFPC